MNTTSETVSSQGTQTGSFPLSNTCYDLITIIYQKSKGLEAYDRYMQDAQGNQQLTQALQQIRQQDSQAVQQLQQILDQELHKGNSGS